MLLQIVFKKMISNIYSNTLGYGATPAEKIEDINSAFKDKNVKAIFCVKGGENSNSLFEYLDYELIKNNPKIICGFSDSTSILNIIYQKTNLVTFHGPTFKSISSWETLYGFEEIIKRFMEGEKALKREDEEFKTIKEGNSEGILIGGNLNCISRMTCGKYNLDFQDKILFIEDLGYESNPKFVNSFLYYMKQNDVFSKIKGLWIGNYEHESGISLEKIVTDVIKDEYKFPIIKSDNFGHIEKKQVIPIGSKVKIDTSNKEKIMLLEECVN